MGQYGGKDWPYPWDTQKHVIPKNDIVDRLEKAALFVGGRENPYSELYISAADEIKKLRLLCDRR